MAQTINPNSFRLGSKLTWWSVAHYNIKNTSLSINGFQIFHNDLLMRKYVEQVFNNFNILVSEIIITRKHTTGKSSFPSKFIVINSENKNSTYSIRKGTPRTPIGGLNKKQLKTDAASNLFNKIKVTHRDNLNLLNEALNSYQPSNNVQFNSAVQSTPSEKGAIYKPSAQRDILYDNKIEKDNITLECLVYFHTHNEKERKLRNVSIFVKKILENLLNNQSNKFNIKFNIKEIPNPTYNVNILSSWIGQELSNNPRRHKAILKKALYQINSNKN